MCEAVMILVWFLGIFMVLGIFKDAPFSLSLTCALFMSFLLYCDIGRVGAVIPIVVWIAVLAVKYNYDRLGDSE